MLRTLANFVNKHFGLPEVLPEGKAYGVDTASNRIVLLAKSEFGMMLPVAEITKLPPRYRILRTKFSSVDCYGKTNEEVILIGTVKEVAEFEARAKMIHQLYYEQLSSVAFADQEFKTLID